MKPWDRLKMCFLLEMGYSIAMLAYQRVWFSILHPQPLIFQFSTTQMSFCFSSSTHITNNPPPVKDFGVLFCGQLSKQSFDQFQERSMKGVESFMQNLHVFEKYYVGEICGSEIGDSTVPEPNFVDHVARMIILGGSSNIDVEKEPWKASTHLINISWNMFKMGIFPNFGGEITTFELHQNRHTETRMWLAGFARGKKWRPHRLGVSK